MPIYYFDLLRGPAKSRKDKVGVTREDIRGALAEALRRARIVTRAAKPDEDSRNWMLVVRDEQRAPLFAFRLATLLRATSSSMLH